MTGAKKLTPILLFPFSCTPVSSRLRVKVHVAYLTGEHDSNGNPSNAFKRRYQPASSTGVPGGFATLFIVVLKVS